MLFSEDRTDVQDSLEAAVQMRPGQHLDIQGEKPHLHPEKECQGHPEEECQGPEHDNQRLGTLSEVSLGESTVMWLLFSPPS